jgi:hypothetical protein
VTRSFKIYQGEDETPEYDLTDPTANVHVIWDEIEAGGRAFRGESTTSSIPIRDEQAVTGNSADLPMGLTNVSLSRGSKWEWLENVGDANETRMAVGRIGTKDYSRGRQKADRAREVVMQGGDRNEELQDIIIDDWVRPEESDVTRVLALLTDYLDGTPRATTVIASTYVATGGTVTMAAKTYDGTNPKAVLDEIASYANKEYFVTIDDELWYDTGDSLTYPAGIKISDRLDELDTEGTCTPDEAALVSAACSNTATDVLSEYGPWVAGGFWEERIEITTDRVIPAGNTLLVAVARSAATSGTVVVYDEQGHTWTLDGQSTAQGSPNIAVAIWRCNVTTPLAIGDYIRFAYRAGTTPNHIDLVSGARCMGVFEVPGTIDNPTVGASTTGFHLGGGSHNVSAPAGEFVFAAITCQDRVVSGDVDWEDAIPSTIIVGGDAFHRMGVFAQYLTEVGATTWTTTNSSSDDYSGFAIAYDWSEAGAGGSEMPRLTFPPKWDVGPSSTEDGLELVSGLRLYYGQDGAYVYVSDATTVAEYWHAERSFYTSDPAISDATKATVLAEAILQRLKTEGRSYNVSIGPLNADQVGCIKPGQLLYIKARAIPDADDQFQPRRIAQLKWTTPVPGVFWARMQLNRPRKEAPFGVGPKASHDAIAAHKEGDSHPASAIVITDAGAYFTGTDVEAALQELGAAAGGAHTHDADDVNIADAGGYYTGTEVEAALQEIGADLAAGTGVTDHGALTGLADDDHPQYQPASVLNVVAASGAAETLDRSLYDTHDVTLTDDCTLTFTGATAGKPQPMAILLRQPASGGPHTVTWPASVEWVGGAAPTLQTGANTWDWVALVTLDGGTTWYAQHAGTSSAVASGFHYEVLMSGDSPAEPLEDGSGTDWLYTLAPD